MQTFWFLKYKLGEQEYLHRYDKLSNLRIHLRELILRIGPNSVTEIEVFSKTFS